MSERLYSNELTDHENALGFRKVYLINPDAGFYGHGSIVPAVIYRLGKCDIIIKINNPAGGVEYSHQKYGTYGSIGRADWKPVLVPFPHAEMAIRSAQSGSDERGVGAQHVHLAEPSISLRCPKCSHEFELAVDSLPSDVQQSCPSCGAADGVEAFSAYNL